MSTVWSVEPMDSHGQGTSICVFASLVPVLVTTACTDARDATIAAVADSIAADLLRPPPPVSGLAIAVSRGGELVLDRAYGLVDITTGQPLEPSRPTTRGA